MINVACQCDVSHYILPLFFSILTDMEAEDVQATCVPAELCMRTESQETVLSRTNMESSSTEFYSCVSETIPSDTSLPCSMTSFHSLETKINEERSHETFITPQDSSIDELLVECATAKTAITTSKEASVASLVNNKDLFVNNNDLLVNNNDLLVNNNDLLVNNNDLLVNNNDLLVNNSSSTVSECSESHSEQTARIHSSYSQMPSCQDSQLNIVRGQIRFISPAATQGELRLVGKHVAKERGGEKRRGGGGGGGEGRREKERKGERERQAERQGGWERGGEGERGRERERKRGNKRRTLLISLCIHMLLSSNV